MVKLDKSVRESACIATDSIGRQALSKVDSKRTISAICLFFSVICVTGCVGDFSEVSPARDDVVRFELVSHADGDPLEVTNPLFRFVADDHLNVRGADPVAALTLSAGAHRPVLSGSWDPLTRELLVEPLDPLRTGLMYTLTLDVSRIRAEAGAVVVADLDEWRFRAEGIVADDRPGVRIVSYDLDIQPVLVESCGCHWEPDGPLTALDARTLRERATSRAARSLVVPYDPARSYLIEKILPDYDDRFGTAMPPPWSTEEPLTDDEIRLISDWILGGAVD